MKADLLVLNAHQVVTPVGFSQKPARGPDQARLEIIEDGAVAIGGGRILEVGSSTELRKSYPVSEDKVVDARGRVVLPGFVDPHTHLVFAGDRASEWEARMQGKPYLEILREGGGILNTVRHTREAPFQELLEGARRWVGRCLAHGTTTLEIKSGYCLNREGELKLLEVAQALRNDGPQTIAATFLGAHVVPPEFAERREAYLEAVEETLEEAKERKLAEFADVFCESEAFTLTESERLLTHARAHGFGLKLHAEQFTPSGATALGARLGAASVDHLEHLSPQDLEFIAAQPAPPVAVLLPAVSFHLGMDRFAPARELIEAGIPVALATDFNPGSSFTPSVPMVIALACRALRLTVAEAIVAVTINAAHALSRGGELGSLEPGKRADLVLCDVPDYRWLGYAFGWNPVRGVIIEGRRVVGNGLP